MINEPISEINDQISSYVNKILASASRSKNLNNGFSDDMNADAIGDVKSNSNSLSKKVNFKDDKEIDKSKK